MIKVTSTDILNYLKEEIKEAEIDLEKARKILHHYSDEGLDTTKGLLKPECRVACLCRDYLAAYDRVKQLKEELRNLQWFCQEQ